MSANAPAAVASPAGLFPASDPAAARLPFWTFEPDFYDSLLVVIGSEVIGFYETRVMISGEGMSYKWNIAESPTADGAIITPMGASPAKVVVSVGMFTPAHWTAWQALCAATQIPGKRGPTLISMVHPFLELHRLRRFWIEKIPLAKPAEPGVFNGEIALLQGLPLKKTPASRDFSLETELGKRPIALPTAPPAR